LRELASVVECENEDNENEGKVKLDWSPFVRREDQGSTLIGNKNHEGRSWLHELVIAGNARALSVIFSPRGGMAWRVAEMVYYHRDRNEQMSQRSFHSETRDLKGISLRDSARLLGSVDIEKMIDEFAVFYLLFDLNQRINFLYKSSDFCVDKDLSKFSGEDPSCVARRLIRFTDEFSDEAHALHPIRSNISSWVERGHASVVTWLVQGDPSLVDSLKTRSIRTRVNMDEFAQLQMYDSRVSKELSEDMDLVSLAAHGPGPCESDYLSHGGCKEYTNLLTTFVRSGGFRDQDLTTFIDAEIESGIYTFRCEVDGMLRYKLTLLRDDESLEDRLQLLSFFMSDSDVFVSPNAVDMIRWRKCGVLRWLVTESFIRLEAVAVSDMQIARRLKHVTFLGKNSIPSSMTVGKFLMFAAVEFDDLQTVQWLVEDCEIRAQDVRCNGWNVMHACAHYGRTEIALWFISQDVLVPLLKEPCSRKPCDKLFAVHLAVQHGAVFLVDQFLEAGCPPQDQNKRSVVWHAKKSKHEFVKEWGKDMSAANDKPVALEKDIAKLYDLLEELGADKVENVKRHITKSKCLDAETWLDCSYRANGLQGPLGKAYWQVIRRCCSFTDADFIVWICREVSYFKECRRFQYSSEFYMFWERPQYETEKSMRQHLWS
jgi:hypothetical protein